jgi:hypothetical protein
MDSEPEDRVSRLESRLSEAREQARVQQNTLDYILQLLQQLQISGVLQAPQNPPTALPAPTVAALAAPTHCEPARGLKPVTPNDFDGDRLKGWAFLNSCRLYISLCKSQFQDDQAKIHWALAFMESGRAALHANHILWRETMETFLVFVSWKGFELDFISKFCLKNEATAALTKLESTWYYQGQKSVDDYLVEWAIVLHGMYKSALVFIYRRTCT